MQVADADAGVDEDADADAIQVLEWEMVLVWGSGGSCSRYAVLRTFQSITV